MEKIIVDIVLSARSVSLARLVILVATIARLVRGITPHTKTRSSSDSA